MTTNTNLSTQRFANTGGPVRLVTSFTRLANATAYSAGDVITDSAEAAVLGFTGAGVSGMITGASVVMGETDTVDLQLFVFDSEPTNHADNAALALANADLDKLVGVFAFTNASKINIGTSKEYYPATTARVGYAYTATKGKLYAFLVTRSAYTPASGAVFAVNIHIEKE